ncbi:helix-turn-helix transcriptional regulator, partial [Streptococcus agalactiae]|nr:helix-turn-helix transcriptional regulator [Streptococcus agalactiae]MCC9857083.1 helix-turn-helix transcriptional regulator [Streptococcus agalactiae]MCK6348980.1 helix-turn-helix domain-containing protein [Streptococcus agalactiae]
FPKRLKSLRQESGLKQQEIAPLLGIKQNTYSDWETGKSEPNLENVVKLAKLFKTTTDFLLGVTDD